MSLFPHPPLLNCLLREKRLSTTSATWEAGFRKPLADDHRADVAEELPLDVGGIEREVQGDGVCGPVDIMLIHLVRTAGSWLLLVWIGMLFDHLKSIGDGCAVNIKFRGNLLGMSVKVAQPLGSALFRGCHDSHSILYFLYVNTSLL